LAGQALTVQEAFSPAAPSRLSRLIAAIIFMALLLLAMLLVTSKERQHISQVHTTALTAAESAVNDLTSMHLKVEELLSGDPNINPVMVGKQFDNALVHLALVQSFAAQDHFFRKHPQAELNARLAELHKQVGLLRTFAEQRMAHPLESRYSAAQDREFDALASGLQEGLEAVIALLDRERQVHVDFAGLLQAGLMTLILLIALATIWLVVVHDRRRHEDFAEVLDARNALHQRDAMLGTIFAASPDMMLIADASLSLIEANDRVVETLGYDRIELLNAGVEALAVRDDGQSQLLEGLSSALQGEVVDFECHLLRKDGSVLPAEVRLRPLQDSEGGPKILLIMRDLSTLHDLQASLLVEEKRYYSIFERSPAALWEEDFAAIKRELDRLRAEGVEDLKAYLEENTEDFQRLAGLLVIRGVNQAALDLHGATSVDQLLQGVGKTFTPVSPSGFVTELVELESGKRECRLETQVKTLKGDLRDIILSASIMPGSETTWERVLVAMVDVTELKDVQRELAEAQRVASLGSWVLDIQNDVLRWSDEIFRIFEIDPERFKASYEAFLELVHPDDRAKLDEEYTRSLQTRQPYDFVHRIVMPDGRIKYVHERCETIFDELDGTPIRSLGTVQDITAQVLAKQGQEEQQRKMEHVQRLESLGVLAGGIAHDFNNLLTAIMGNAGLAREHIPTTSQAVSYLDRVESTSKRAADLCQQMLAYSGKGRFVVRPINLSDLVNEMAHLLQVSISKGIILRLDLSQPMPAVEADVAQMQQVVMNLVTNAAEAIGERSGAITIATGVANVDEHYLVGAVADEQLPLGRYAYVEVSDTGVGMDEATRLRIFEPFFTTKFTGRGLGMAAVLGIVRGHKGAIRIYSEPGKGSTFKVLFPCQEFAAESSLPSEETTSAKWRSSATVLVVDDEEPIREVASMMLERIGMRVMLAGDGVEAVEIFKDHHAEIDAVLLDMTMPRMGGEEAFVQLRRIDPQVKVILSSGYNEQDATNRFAGKKLAGFIKKPYTSELLFAKLREVMESPEANA